MSKSLQNVLVCFEYMRSEEGLWMDSRGKYLIKNLSVLTVSNFASKILVFLLVPLYTSVLSVEEFGKYDLITSTLILLFPLLTVNIADAVMRFLMDTAKNKDDVVQIGVMMLTISWIVLLAVCGGLYLTKTIPSVVGYEFYIFIYYLFYSSHQFLIQYAKGEEKVTDMAIAGVAGTLAMIFFNILFLITFHWGLEGFFIANSLGQAIPAVYMFGRLRVWMHIRKHGLKVDLLKEMVAYCAPLLVTITGWWINSTSDKYIVSFIYGISAAGLLSVAYKIPQIINTLQNIFIQAWQISAIKEYREDSVSDFYGIMFRITNALMSLCCSTLIVLTKPISFILFQKDFRSAQEYAPLLVVSCVINCSSGFLGSILSAKKDSKSMALSALYGAGINIVMNFLLVYVIGIQGATIATVIASFIMYSVRKKAVGDGIVVKDYNIVLITWVVIIAQAFLEVFTSLWIMEIILIIFIIVINIDVIGQIIKRAFGTK